MIRGPASRLTRLRRYLQLWSARYATGFHARSAASIAWLKDRLTLLGYFWLAAIALLGAWKFAGSETPIGNVGGVFELALPYLLIAIAPLAGFRLGHAAFRRNRRQPATRLSLLGRWRSLAYRKVRGHASFGVSGLVATLIVGLLFGIGLRTFEFALAIPALDSGAPGWAHSLFLVASAELVVMNFLYMICFAMALYRVPLFPRMMVFVWLVDIASQLTMAGFYAGLDLPADAVMALTQILTNNANGVLLSMAIWLPYLILSERVNVTFRHRIAG